MLARTLPGKIMEEQEQEFEESGSGGLSVCSIIKLFSVVFIEIFDIVTELLHLTGGWLIVAFIIDILSVAYFLLLSLACEGFSFQAIFSSWQQTATMIISFASQFIPILDLLPGWATGVYATQLLKLLGINIPGKKTKEKEKS